MVPLVRMAIGLLFGDVQLLKAFLWAFELLSRAFHVPPACEHRFRHPTRSYISHQHAIPMISPSSLDTGMNVELFEVVG